MRYLLILSFFIFCSCSDKTKNLDANDVQSNQENSTSTETMDYALVIHGGAGTILKKNMTDELEENYLMALEYALKTGEEVLKAGGTSIEAVQKTINTMEDSPLFNAGKGAVFNHNGENEMDASIMSGRDLMAGAVGGVSTIRNPIDAAIKVMTDSDHVMLTGAGAELFAREQGLEIVDPQYFFTENRWNSLQRILKKDIGSVEELKNYKYGTVGAVALDKNGNITAGTSTGGMTNKKWNRIGDSPIIGAGTYANNNTCGVSCTGHGEFFIRYAVAHDISALVEYKNMSVQEAGAFVINDKLAKAKGDGGAIILDKYGNVAMPFNSAGMYRGYIKSDGSKEVKIYKN